ncbi:MAG: alpha-galactosidase [Puniceicoccaceae bacterium 5H]|nr:MAG: alpha-galactosidase [Puniceicoccaceae bacterium 5H]
MSKHGIGLCLLALGAATMAHAAPVAEVVAEAPHSDQAPRINGPSLFGVRPGHPCLYAIPATGARPMTYAVEGLPEGLAVDSETGIITGRLAEAGDYEVTLRARNARGEAQKRFVLKCGEKICLTPPMGWNSWNCWGTDVDREKVLRAAQALVSTGLAQHGWTYVNIDDAWQGERQEGSALQPNEKFTDLSGLCDEIHARGLKVGIYSTPWTTSYGGFAGSSSDQADGAWAAEAGDDLGRHFGRYAFIEADARQWADWGIDYLKYDWAPIDIAHAATAYEALRDSGRDIVLSLSNSAALSLADQLPEVANCWRTTGDIGDQWQYLRGDDASWRWGVSEIGFSQDRWAPAAGPGHWNDADMLVLGRVGWGDTQHPTKLTRNEQYSHMSLWCMLSSPLLLGCDLERLDDFTLSLLTNDEVIAINQDALGRQAVRVATVGAVDVYLKPLETGAFALAFFNRSEQTQTFLFNKMEKVGLGGPHHVRDLWQRRDLPDCDGEIKGTVGGHGVLLLQLEPVVPQS